ncbi:MAG: hypothetical protein DWQ31_03215 [Planctomycetota bacterium]|nr:MAG: hypothetical protein DWQ31_03215 [Planctomycetota bacterium]REJ90010.1 MAG: hypothetical protein DWQ35_17505 [Planctomycetota bacterium]REK22394.1 MAG: hypothetical protein DWQ42_17135 [Planctomycetota bacterium]REK39746.1 MAG: hypothetical protein DWQ46_17675 [Planctomycetota bacterium]
MIVAVLFSVVASLAVFFMLIGLAAGELTPFATVLAPFCAIAGVVFGWRFFAGLRQPAASARANWLHRRTASAILVLASLLGAVLITMEARQSLKMTDERIAFLRESIANSSNGTLLPDKQLQLRIAESKRSGIVMATPLAAGWAICSLVAAGCLLFLKRGSVAGT